MAAKRGCSYLVDYLIVKEADINIKDNKGVNKSLSDNTSEKKLALLIHINLVNLVPVYPGDDVINSLKEEFLALIKSKAPGRI